METFAIHKSAMIAPRKARMTLDLIRGKKVSDAAEIIVYDMRNRESSTILDKTDYEVETIKL